jgi:hypothetical protein
MIPTSALSFGVDNVIPFSMTGSPVDEFATWWWDATAGGIDFGNPDEITTEIQSQLLDGSLGSITSWENRTLVLTLRLWGSSVADLEDGEAALLAEVDRAGWNQLAWTPSIDGSATTVYDVVYSVLAFTLDEPSERNLIRNYTLTLTCLPRPRSADPVTVASLPVPPPTPTTVTVDDCSSTTGWSSTSGTVSEASGMVSTGGSIAASTPGTTTLNLTRTGSVTMGATPYLIISGTYAVRGTVTGFTFTVDGTKVSPASLSVAGGTWQAVLYEPASFASLAVDMTAGYVPDLGSALVVLRVDNVARSDSNGASATNRQQSRSLLVYGSARTQASLRVETADAELGPETLVFAAPPQSSGFQPPLRSRRVGGPSATTSTTAASGATNTLATSQASADHWSVSTTILQPATYEMYALLSVAATTTVTLSWQASGTAAGTPTVTGSRTVTLQPGYQFVSIGSIELPTARAYAGSSDDVQLWLWASASGVTIDDAYLFSGAGHLAIIGTAGCSLLLLNSASIDEPEATAWVGKAAGSSGGDPDVDTDVVYAGNRAQAWEQLQFAPPATNVFVATPGTTQAQVSMTYYPRWGHHAGQVAA